MAKQNGEAVKPELGHVKANIRSKKKKRFFSRETRQMRDSSFHLTSHMEAKSLLPLQGYFFFF